MRAAVHEVEHHLAHPGSAFLVSPFDEAVAVSVDGFGDFASAAWGVGRGGRVEADARRTLIPAVTHVDGSGRLQTVTRATNRGTMIRPEAAYNTVTT